MKLEKGLILGENFGSVAGNMDWKCFSVGFFDLPKWCLSCGLDMERKRCKIAFNDVKFALREERWQGAFSTKTI